MLSTATVLDRTDPIAYLEPYPQALTAKTAAHLLRRATFGPTQAEITHFTGLTATQAVQQLINNANYSPAPPADIDSTKATAGQTYLDKPFKQRPQFRFWALPAVLVAGADDRPDHPT